MICCWMLRVKFEGSELLSTARLFQKGNETIKSAPNLEVNVANKGPLCVSQG